MSSKLKCSTTPDVVYPVKTDSQYSPHDMEILSSVDWVVQKLRLKGLEEYSACIVDRTLADNNPLCFDCCVTNISAGLGVTLPYDILKEIYYHFSGMYGGDNLIYCSRCYPLATHSWFQLMLNDNYTRYVQDQDNRADALLRGTCGDRFLQSLGLSSDVDFVAGTRFLGTIFGVMLRSRVYLKPKNKLKLVLLSTYEDSSSNHIELIDVSDVPGFIAQCCAEGSNFVVNLSDSVSGALRCDFIGHQITTLNNAAISLAVKGLPVYSDPRMHNQFFKPTRFQSFFQSRAKFEVMRRIDPTYVSSLDNLVAESSKAKNQTRYANFIAEPGTGKTVAFPFRFEKSSVAVVLPTAFDAWTGYSVADGVANLRTYSQTINRGASVTYYDSYTAGYALCNNEFLFDVVVIDEADSSAGITAALVELEIPKAFVVHVSGTAADTRVERTAAFPVEEVPDLPSVTEDFPAAVEYVKEKSASAHRSVVMTPDPKTARKLSKHLPKSRVLSADSDFSELSEVFAEQEEPLLLVTDDVCSRGVNLNLDAVFDFQLVGPTQGRRTVTLSEMRQRRGRVGRLKPGVYHYSSTSYATSNFTELDVFRANVARAVFGTPQVPSTTAVDLQALPKLMISDYEPLFRQMELVDSEAIISRKSLSRRQSSSSSVDLAPGWVKWAAGYKSRNKPRSSVGSVKSKDDVVYRDRSSSSETRYDVAKPRGAVDTPLTSATATSFPRAAVEKTRPTITRRPPAFDLTLWKDDTSWPEALSDLYAAGDPLPMIIPPRGWVYTKGMPEGQNYLERLQGVIRDGTTFSATEFELVARAWNVLVSRASFSFKRGQDVWSDDPLIVFCVEYFDGYVISS